jgi:hypothetical protein
MYSILRTFEKEKPLTKSYLIGWIQQTHICPQTVIDHPPSKCQQLVLLPNVLNELQQGAIWLVHNEAAIQVLQKIELTLQDVVCSVGELL